MATVEELRVRMPQIVTEIELVMDGTNPVPELSHVMEMLAEVADGVASIARRMPKSSVSTTPEA